MEDLTNHARRFHAALHESALDAKARELGVSPRALRTLKCGLATQSEMRLLEVGFGGGAIPVDALTFPERDSDGAVIGITFRSSDGRKGTPTGAKRGLVYSPELVTPGPHLLVEGPTDTAAGITLHIPTIGRPSCSSGAKWLAELKDLRSRDALILADSDKAGWDGARKLAQRLANEWKRPVRWATLPDGAKDLRAYLITLGLDVTDEERCAAAGVRLLELLAKNAETVHPVGLTKCFVDIEARPVTWLVKPFVAIGKTSLLAGQPGLGKSLFTADLAARVSTGRGFDDQGQRREPADILFLSAEDDPADTIRPRLEAAGAELRRVHFSGNLDLDTLKSMLDELPNVRLVIVDPLSAYVGHIESHNDAKVRTHMAPFAELAAERHVAILFVAHLKKSGEGDAITRPGGSIAFVAAARVAWIVLKDPGNAERRLILTLKNNVGPEADGFAYRIEADGPESAPRMVWEPGRVKESADDVLARTAARRSGRSGGAALEEACTFLNDLLANGPRLQEDIQGIAEGHEITPATLKRAKHHLQVKSSKHGMSGGWEWSLPARGIAPATPFPVSEAQRGGEA